MKITNIRTMLLKGPLYHGQGGESGGTATKMVMRVDTDAGLYGLGEADELVGVRESVDYIRACFVGRDPLDVHPFVSEMLYGSLPPHPPQLRYDPDRHGPDFQPWLMSSPTATPTGPIAWAMSGVEMALCDLAGKACGMPVYRLLGGKYRDHVRIYLDRSSPLAIDDLSAWRAMAEAVVRDGFTQMKFDVDYTASDYTEDPWNRSLTRRQLNRIVERLAAVREAAGPDFDICADCHMQFNSVDAIRLANELAPLKLMWLEDPTPITNPDACADVRSKSPIPIAVGEMFIAEQFRLFIDRGACDIIHPDVVLSGGLYETRRIADYAELHYLPMAMHGNGGCVATVAAAHVAAASRNFLGLEYHFIETPWIGQFARREGVPLFADGYVRLTDAPGLGIELDEAVCKQFLAPHESLF